MGNALELLLTATTPPGMTAMLLNLQRHVLDVDLLDHSGPIVGMGCK